MLWTTLDITNHTHLKRFNKYNFYGSLTTCKKPTLWFTSFLRWSWLTIWYDFGNDQACLTIPTLNDWLICCFHGRLITYKHSTLYVNSFVKYFSLNNTSFWLVLQFFDHNSRTRFFVVVPFLQEVRTTTVYNKALQKNIFYANKDVEIHNLLD